MANTEGIELHMITHQFSFSPVGLFVIIWVFYLFPGYIWV